MTPEELTHLAEIEERRKKAPPTSAIVSYIARHVEHKTDGSDYEVCRDSCPACALTTITGILSDFSVDVPWMSQKLREQEALIRELQEELRCTAKDRDSWAAQSRKHNIDRIAAVDAVAEADRQLAELQEDQKRLDWLDNFVQHEGLAESCFELDGGVHLTIHPFGGRTEEGLAYRHKKDLRAAIDSARDAEAKGEK